MFCIPFRVDAFNAFDVLLLGVYFYLILFLGVAINDGCECFVWRLACTAGSENL